MPLPTYNPSYYTDINSSKKWGNLNINYTFKTQFYDDNLFTVKDLGGKSISGVVTQTNTAAAISAMNEWARVLGVKFQLAANYADAQLSLLNVASVTDGVDANNKPLRYDGVTINNNPPSTYTFNSIFIEPAAAASKYLWMHELGHALGLDHPLHGFGNAAGYNIDTTIMSYNKGAADLSGDHGLLTPMIYDIAAVQQIYGKANINMSTKDDTTYSRTENAIPNSTLKTIVIDGVKHEMFTLWDAGGYHDLIDISTVGETPIAKGYDSCHLLDLRGMDAEGNITYSKVGNQVFNFALDPEKNWEKPIEIENAFGAKNAPNLIYGNDAKNELTGGDKNDSITGGLGMDTVNGGAGNDVLWGVIDAAHLAANDNAYKLQKRA